MRLRTSDSFFLLKNGLLNSYPSLRNTNESCDIVVIGAGITGALISHSLMEKGYDVILIDKRDVGAGSTAATTCMLQYEIDVPLIRLAELIGTHGAVKCYKAGIDAISELEELARSLALKCDFARKESLYFARTKKDSEELHKEYVIRDQHQLGVTWLGTKEVEDDYGIISQGAILSSAAASIDAYQLTHELIAYNVVRGMRVYDQTTISNYHYDKTKTILTTGSNCIIECNKLVFCSGYESVKFLEEEIAHLFYTYASISEQNIQIPEKLKSTLVWDTGNPYSYMRYTDDKRLLIGGEDQRLRFSFFQNRVKQQKSIRLQASLKTIMPKLEFIEDFCWAGIFGSTKDGLPYIGLSPKHKNAVFVLAFGGNGIVFAVQGMKIIHDLLENRENELAGFYRFGR